MRVMYVKIFCLKKTDDKRDAVLVLLPIYLDQAPEHDDLRLNRLIDCNINFINSHLLHMLIMEMTRSSAFPFKLS